MHQRNSFRIHTIHLDDEAGHRVHFYRTLSDTISSSSLLSVRHKNISIYEWLQSTCVDPFAPPCQAHRGEEKGEDDERGIKKLKRYPNNVRNIR